MYSIKKAEESDIREMCRLEQECFSSPWSEAAFTETMRSDGGVFFVCECDGQIVGYAGAVCVADECSVTNVAVTANYRRQGISRMLLDALEREASGRGACTLFLEVRVSNAPAISAYESRGCERCGVRRNFYSIPTEDAYVYKKELKKEVQDR